MRAAVMLLVFVVAAPAQGERLHLTWLWHMEQPIYWPDQQATGADRYERAWESILGRMAGAPHPENDVAQIFSVPDRVAAYQWRVRDAIASISWLPEAGAQVSFSGGLIENLQSLGAASQLGYGGAWWQWYREARGWLTPGRGARRCDLVLFPFHHPLCPLIDDSALRKEIALHREVYGEAWGPGPSSRGFFPSEMAFSVRMTPALVDAGVDWCFVSAEKISRACSGFPIIYGSGGIMCDPPNAADQVNPSQASWFRRTISRGCSPAEAYPFALTPHRARYVDPDTGVASEIVVVPCSQSLGWDDGYAPLGTSALTTLQAGNPAGRPMLVVLAHDGDNNWGGGYSYYSQAVPDLAGQAAAQGFHPTVVEEYLADHPVPPGDVVHVEDGAWVNADGDFGAPQFLNWNWPPVDAQGTVDVANGWAEDIRNWAVITAAQNHVDTAEQMWMDAGGSVSLQRILHPGVTANAVERAWHYFLGSLNSGYMYYGTALDMELKPTVACNEALEHTATVTTGGATPDTTPPTVWIPQRWPWNPGGVNFGAPYRYQQVVEPSDFQVWTFVHDVSGTASVELRVRVDQDGVNPLNTDVNETYAGGPGVGPWQSIAMASRPFPAGNVYGDPTISFSEMPLAIADQHHAWVTGFTDVLLDYYVVATDVFGNERRSPIQHVWVGSGGPPPGAAPVTVTPDPPVAGQTVQVAYDATSGPLAGAASVFLHYGFDDWATVNPVDPAMTRDPAAGRWTVTVAVPSTATQLDCVFHDGQGNWHNNNGQDWHFPVTGTAPPPTWVLDGQLDRDASRVGSTNGATLWAGVKGDFLYVATEPAGGGHDRFVLVADTPGPLQPAMWAKAGTVAAWDAFLGQEADNGWHGWFEAGGPTASAAGSVVEGTLDLAAAYGSVPPTIRLALALYATPNGGALDPTRQVAATLNGDGHVQAGEYAAFAQATLAASGSLVPGTQVAIGLESSAEPGRPYVCGIALATAPGIPIPDGREIPIAADTILELSLTPGNPWFLDTQGTLDLLGRGTVLVNVPALPGLSGLQLFAGLVTLDGAGVRSIAAPLPLTVR